MPTEPSNQTGSSPTANDCGRPPGPSGRTLKRRGVFQEVLLKERAWLMWRWVLLSDGAVAQVKEGRYIPVGLSSSRISHVWTKVWLDGLNQGGCWIWGGVTALLLYHKPHYQTPVGEGSSIPWAEADVITQHFSPSWLGSGKFLHHPKLVMGDNPAQASKI